MYVVKVERLLFWEEKRDQQERGRQKTVMRGEYDQSTFSACMEVH
jgi:hypothetical protein